MAGAISPVRYVKSTKIQVKMCALGMNIMCRFVNIQNNFINHIRIVTKSPSSTNSALM